MGSKLQKITEEKDITISHNGSSYTTDVTTTTDYSGVFVYKSKSYSSPELSELAYSKKLQFFSHEEGRVRPLEGNNETPFVYDYFIKDHLGNVRMILTEEEKQDKYPVASLEDSKIEIEKNYYDINTSNVADKSEAIGITDYVNDNGIGNNPEDDNFSSANSDKLYKLNSNTAKTGLGITLKVMAGDRIDVFGKSYYFENTSGTGSNSPITVLDLLNSFLNTPAAAGTTHGITGPDLNNSVNLPGINSMISQQSSQSNAAPNKPRAFINVIFFDEQFKSYNFKLSMAGEAGIIKEHFSELQNIAAAKNGYVYIYCINESPVNVFFDNLQIVQSDAFGTNFVTNLVTNLLDANFKLLSHTHNHPKDNVGYPSSKGNSAVEGASGDTGAYEFWSKKQADGFKIYLRYNGVTREFDVKGNEIKPPKK